MLSVEALRCALDMHTRTQAHVQLEPYKRCVPGHSFLLGFNREQMVGTQSSFSFFKIQTGLRINPS